MNNEVSQNWSTAIAACTIIFVASVILWRDHVSLVVIITGILPLGASVAMLNAIIELMKVSSLKGELLDQSSVALISNLGKVFTTSISNIIGLAVGLGIVNKIEHRKK